MYPDRFPSASVEVPQLISRVDPPRTVSGTVIVDGAEGARFQMIVYAPSESGLSDTKMSDLILQSGRTPQSPWYAPWLFHAPEEVTLRTSHELDA